jgi:hypothetical protein
LRVVAVEDMVMEGRVAQEVLELAQDYLLLLAILTQLRLVGVALHPQVMHKHHRVVILLSLAHPLQKTQVVQELTP